MKVKSLELKNFRNYGNESFIFDDNINIIHGLNAQGKTNILEAIYLFSLGKSNRTIRDSELIKFGEEFCEARLLFEDENRKNTEKICISSKKKKNIYINDILIRKNSELVGKFNAVYFGPEYLDLIKGGPKKRRKNTDIIISQLKVSYFSAAAEMKNIIEQKSAALKSEKPNKMIISVLNERLLEEAVTICKLRYEYLKKIEKIAADLQKQISEENESFEIKYISPIGLTEEFDEAFFREEMKKRLEKNSEKELFLKECIVGPHRDDIEYKINGLDVKSFASQGQQKTTVLVQKIAEVELFKEERGEYPVLLLDDIMSELDEKRQRFVTEKIKNMQIFITCTNKEALGKLKKGKFFEISKGRLI